jgi:hypothetical protein
MAKSLKTFVAQVLIKILYNSVAEIRNMLNIDDIRQLRHSSLHDTEKNHRNA